MRMRSPEQSGWQQIQSAGMFTGLSSNVENQLEQVWSRYVGKREGDRVLGALMLQILKVSSLDHRACVDLGCLCVPD